MSGDPPTLRLRARDRREHLNKLAITSSGKLVYGPNCPLLVIPYEYTSVDFTQWSCKLFGNLSFGPGAPTREDYDDLSPYGTPRWYRGDFTSALDWDGTTFKNPDVGLYRDLSFYDVFSTASLSPANDSLVPFVCGDGDYASITSQSLSYSDPTRRFWFYFKYTSHSYHSTDPSFPPPTRMASHDIEWPVVYERHTWRFSSNVYTAPNTTAPVLNSWWGTNFPRTPVRMPDASIELLIYYKDIWIPVLKQFMPVADHATISCSNPVIASSFNVSGVPQVIHSSVPAYWHM